MYSTRYLFVLFFLFLFQFSSSQKQHFTKAQIQEDLGILKEQLLELHPNLMVYHSKAAFNIFFDHLDLPEHTSVEEAYGIIASTSAIIQDGHTLFYPDIQLIKERNGNGHFIPLKIFWDGSSLFIDENYSSNKNINPGTRIIAINGIYSEELIDFMLQRMMRDGNNLNYPIWVLNQYFFEYYSYFYGCPKTFRLMIEDNNGTQKEVALEGLLKADLFEERNANDKERKGIDIVLNQPNSTAILTIKDWHNSILKKYYQQNFKKEITQIFEYIKEKKIKNLVIDVRDNQGGDTQNSKLVLSYLLEQPFQLVEEYKVVKKGELVDAKGPQMGWHQTKKDAFQGRILVLLNGGSFSNTGIFCAALKKYNRAIFIGEETGGSAFVICGNTKRITLPNTKIQIDLPRLQFLIQPYQLSNLSGIKPDYEIKPTIKNLIEGRDAAKEFAMKLIQEAM